MSTAATTLTAEPVTAPPNGAPPAAAAPQDWRAALPEDLRGEKSFEKFKGVPDLAKSYKELEGSMGNALRLPKPDAPDAEWDKVYSRMGRPESADKYELKLTEGIDEAKRDGDLEKGYKEWAHKAGLNLRQAQSLYDQFNQFQISRMENYTKSMTDGVAALKKEWGTSYDKNIGMATKAVKELGSDELKGLLEETGLGNHPALIKFFSKLGADMSEDMLVVGDATHGAGETAEAIQEKLNAVYKNPAYLNTDRKATQKEHDAVVESAQALTKQLALLTGEE